MEEAETLHVSKQDISDMKYKLKDIIEDAKKLKKKIEMYASRGKEFNCKKDTIKESCKCIAELSKYLNENNTTDLSDDNKLRPNAYYKYLLEHTGNFEE